MKTARFWTTLACLMTALTACTSTGGGDGRLSGAGAADQPVAFSWTSKDGGLSGTLTAVLPGQVFEGPFFQITQQTRSEVLTPLWQYWRPGWHDWPARGGFLLPMYPATEFVTHYSGQVLATLASPTQQRMRCRFQLMAPATGMSGGGEGECQLGDGRLVRARLAGHAR